MPRALPFVGFNRTHGSVTSNTSSELTVTQGIAAQSPADSSIGCHRWIRQIWRYSPLLPVERTATCRYSAGMMNHRSPVGQPRDVALLLGFGIKSEPGFQYIWANAGCSSALHPHALIAAAQAGISFDGMWRTLSNFGDPAIRLMCVASILGCATEILVDHTTLNPLLVRLISWFSAANASTGIADFDAGLVAAAIGRRKPIAATPVAGVAP